jgi:hypothetical protein
MLSGTSCTIALTFTPAAMGLQSGTLTITGNATDSPKTVPLSGTGATPVTLSATAESFGYVAFNEKSIVRKVTLYNNQLSALTIASLTVSGTGFALDSSTTCPAARSQAM